MICLECVNGLRRDMPGKTEVVCCLDSRLVMSVFKCNFFFRAVDDRPIVESVMPDLKYEVEDTKRKIMTSHYQDIVQRLKEEQKGIDPVDEVYGKSLVEDVNEYMQKEQSVMPDIHIEHDLSLNKLGQEILDSSKKMPVDNWKYEKRGRGRPRKT